jgi:hypothetical protein
MDVTLTPPGELYSRDFRTGSEAARSGSAIKLLQVLRAYFQSRIPAGCRAAVPRHLPAPHLPPPAATTTLWPTGAASTAVEH